MPPKHIFDYIYNQFIQHGCLLLETEYINSKTKMKYICSCGNKSEINFNNFQQGQRCKECGYNEVSKKLSLDYKYINDFIKSKNWILNSKIYINSHEKLDLTCPNNHQSYISFTCFYGGTRCIACLDKLYPDIEFIKIYSKSQGFECLSNIYINSHEKLIFKCINNHIFNIMWYKFYNENQRCRQCYNDNNFGKNHSRWNEDRTKQIRGSYLTFDKKQYKFLNDDSNYLLYLFYKNLSDEKIIDKNIYEIDHIFPRKAFIDNNLDNIHTPSIIKQICNLRENLRIIPHEENSDKRAKYNQEEFMEWFNTKLKENLS